METSRGQRFLVNDGIYAQLADLSRLHKRYVV